jgi:hypothetical protein
MDTFLAIYLELVPIINICHTPSINTGIVQKCYELSKECFIYPNIHKTSFNYVLPKNNNTLPQSRLSLVLSPFSPEKVNTWKKITIVPVQ